MEKVYLGLNWLFGVLILIIGLVSLITSPLASLSLIAIAMLLLPPVRAFAYSKTNKQIPTKARAISIAVLFILFVVFVGQDQANKKEALEVKKEQELAKKVAAANKKKVEYFNANRADIIAKAKSILSSKDYKAVINLSNQYLIAKDKELQGINSKAKQELAVIQKAQKTKDLLAKLKTVPYKEYQKNKDLYSQLLKLHPKNETYSKKVALYTTKIAEEVRKKELLAKRTEMIKKQFSPWDGSHRNLERMIKKAMNDPDSYDHVETTYADKGTYLIVQTVYRGKNGFGGTVKGFVKAQISLDGTILKVLSQG